MSRLPVEAQLDSAFMMISQLYRESCTALMFLLVPPGGRNGNLRYYDPDLKLALTKSELKLVELF